MDQQAKSMEGTHFGKREQEADWEEGIEVKAAEAQVGAICGEEWMRVGGE